MSALIPELQPVEQEPAVEPITLHSDAKHVLHACENTLLKIKEHLGLTSWNHWVKNNVDKPWILVLGSNQAGKTHLLQQTELHWQYSLCQQPGFTNVWINEHALYWEIPGITLTDSSWQGFWLEFTTLLKTNRCAKFIKHIVLAVNLLQLSQQKSGPQYLSHDQLIPTLQHLTHSIRREKLNMTVVMTHLDQVAGCAEFFAKMTQDERKQVLGFSLKPVKDPEQVLDHYQENILPLLRKLHRRSIEVIQQSRPEDTLRIQDFPLQLEGLRLATKQLLETLVRGTDHINIVGLYFVANHFQGNSIDFLSRAVERTFSLDKITSRKLASQNSSLFSQQLIETLLPSSIKQLDEKKRWIPSRWRPMIQYGTATCLFLGVTAWMIHQMNHDLKTITRTEQALTAYHNHKDYHRLEALENLHKHNTELAAERGILHHIFVHMPSLRHKLNFLFLFYLKRDFMQQINEDISSQLSNDLTSSEKRYNLLKIYLMLSQTNHRDDQFLKTQLPLVWQTEHVKEDNIKLREQFLDIALHSHLTSHDADQQLVSKTRDQLNLLPLSFIAYTLLKSKSHDHQDISISAFNTNLFSFPTSNIPYLYTKAGYEHLNENLHTILESLHDGDWVLGKTEIANIDSDAITRQVKTLYVADYKNWWNLFIFNIRPIVFKDYKQAQAFFTNLCDPDHGYAQLLAIIKQNANIQVSDVNAPQTESAEDGENEATEQFTQLTDINDTHSAKFVELNKLVNHYLADLANKDSRDEAVFYIVKQQFTAPDPNNPINRLYDQAKTLPTPVKEWFQAIALNSWYLLFNKSEAIINRHWTDSIYPNYVLNIKDRYPVDKNAKDVIQLNKFTEFFAHKGLFDNFFNQYLAPFISTDQVQWQPKQYLGLQFTFSNDILEQLERAVIIRDMFFPHHNTKLNLQFGLQPESVTNEIHNIILNVNDQKMYDYPGSKKISTFYWPGPTPSNLTAIQIENKDRKIMTVRKTGPWSFFQLLDDLQLNKALDERHYLMQVPYGNEMILYTLSSPELINPFIPGMLHDFKLPDAVTVKQKMEKESSPTDFKTKT